MKQFIINIKAQIDGHENIFIRLVREINKDRACEQALLDECHGTIGENATWTDNGISDLGGDVHYSVHTCVEVEPEHVDVLKLYLN